MSYPSEKIATKGQGPMLKNFYGRNLQLLMISSSVSPGQTFQSLCARPGAYPRINHLKHALLG